MTQTKTKNVRNLDANTLLPEDAPIHNWYRFVLSFPPHLVRTYLDRFGATGRSRVLDPFCGTGTTLVECRKIGVPSVGVEANHMAYFASTTKTTWDIDADAFLDDSLRVGRIAREITAASGVLDYSDLPMFAPQQLPAQLRDLSEEQWKVLSRAFISPLPLHRTLILLDSIRARPNRSWLAHQELALAKSLVSGIGNVAFGPEIGATNPKQDVDVIAIWLRHCRQMSEGLKQICKSSLDTPISVRHGDSRAGLEAGEKFDIVITSPPYPNEKDYTRTTRLESVILGFIKDRRDLRELKRNLLRSNTRNVFVADEDDKWVRHFASITQLANEIESRRKELGKTSGFEKLYHRVVLLYFGGMMRHLEALKQNLRPGAKLAYVVGDQMSYFRIPIRTGQVLAELADYLGYHVDSIDLFRSRLATATKEWLREEVVVLSKSVP